MCCIRSFSDFIEANKFVDLPLARVKYTWSNNQERVVKSIIVISQGVEEHFVGII